MVYICGTMRLQQTLTSVLFNKCPKCHSGKVFEDNNPFNFRKMLNMLPVCPSCGNVYEREPGYFTGAMYVAYALTSAWFVLWFVLQITVLDWPVLYFFLFVVGTVTLLAPLTFRWSRILWLNLFTSFDDKLKPKDHGN